MAVAHGKFTSVLGDYEWAGAGPPPADAPVHVKRALAFMPGSTWHELERLARAQEEQARWANDPAGGLFFRVAEARSERSRWTAASELRDAMPRLVLWRFKNPRVDEFLRREAKVQGREVVRVWLRDTLFPGAIIDVAKGYRVARRIRLGRAWVAAECGRVIPHRPADRLSLPDFRRWLTQEVRSAVERILLAEVGDERRAQCRRARSSPARLFRADPEALRKLLPRRSKTPRDEKMLRLLARGTAAEVAVILKLTPGAVRAQKSRLKQRLRAVRA